MEKSPRPRAGQFGIKGVIFGKLAGKKPVGQPCLFGGTLRRQPIGHALALVGAVARADPHQHRFGHGTQQGIEPPKADIEGGRRRALRGVGRGVKLAQQAKEQVFLGQGMGQSVGHGRAVLCSKVNIRIERSAVKVFVQN